MNPNFEAPYLEPFVVKKNILALIKEEETAQKISKEDSRGAPDLNENVSLHVEPLTPMKHASYDEEVNHAA